MKDTCKKINRYALILAGGNGTRLFPISTTSRPKQYLKLYEDNIMINATINRIKPIFDNENIFVIINKEQEKLANRYIDFSIPRGNIICEPMAKNTAMCIFYATLKIKKAKGNGIMTILSSDHYVKQEQKLLDNILEGIKIAEDSESLVTIGIKPTYPATGFGYIKYECDENKKYNVVKEFKEKPNYDKAIEYLKSERYYWNSGMFIWTIQTILDNFQKYLPELYQYRNDIENTIDQHNEKIEVIYNNVSSISIDKGILEKANNIKMVKGEFEWMDIGSINDFFKIKSKNIKNNTEIGNVITQETKETNIYNENEKYLVATIGVDNLNIINCNGVILIANKDKMSELPKLIEKIKENEQYKKYL